MVQDALIDKLYAVCLALALFTKEKSVIGVQLFEKVITKRCVNQHDEVEIKFVLQTQFGVLPQHLFCPHNSPTFGPRNDPKSAGNLPAVHAVDGVLTVGLICLMP